MEFVPKEPLLELSYDDLQEIRKMYDLDKPEKMKEAVDIIEEWLEKQNHIVKKDFSRRFLEATILSSKGSLERTKVRIDKMCTFRTLLPQYFGFCSLNDFQQLFECIKVAILPKKALNQNRVLLAKAVKSVDGFYPDVILHAVRFGTLIAEYIKVHDVLDGAIFVLDYRNVNIVNMMKNVNLIDLRHGMTILTEGIGCNLRGMHIITSSKYVEMLVTVLKQVVSAKIGSRIHVHKTIESVHEEIPKEILPEEYGGKEKSVEELHDEWNKLYFSEEHIEYMKNMNKCRTDESLRENEIFNGQNMGMQGTFRTLSLD